MSNPPALFIIDAHAHPETLHAAGDRPPVILETLRAAQLDGASAVLAPTILCTDDTAARARGALLITDDQDGAVIVLPEAMPIAERRVVAAAHAWRVQPEARVTYLDAACGSAEGTPITPSPICDREAFHQSQLQGCIVPTEWLLLAIETGDCL